VIRKIDYKTYSFNKKEIIFPARVWELKIFEFHQIVVVKIWPKESDAEYNWEYKYPPFKNIRCYDMEGNLKWMFPLGIVGMDKADENTVKLFDGEYVHYVNVVTGIEDKSRMQFLK